MCRLLEFIDGGSEPYNIRPSTLPSPDAPSQVTVESPSLLAFLRPDAFKLIVFVNDGWSSCTYNDVLFRDRARTSGPDLNPATTENLLAVAESWADFLQMTSPSQFGTDASNRKFSVWNISGLEPFNPTEVKPGGEPRPPDQSIAPITLRTCGPSAFSSSETSQAIAVETGGLRYPSCAPDFTDFFTEMTRGVDEGSRIPCAFEIPESESGLEVDINTIEMTYTDSTGAQTRLSRAMTGADCSEGGFLVKDGQLSLCPSACSLVEADDKGKLDTLFGCDLDLK